jgi:iron complex transport system substrate-binding protein
MNAVRWMHLVAVAVFVWSAANTASTANAAEIRVSDDRGVPVVLPQSPLRIVSLLPSLTETVCELGQCQRLVGVDRYSNPPAMVRALPKTGGGIDPNIEAIVALKPDLVLMATSSRGVERLEAFGLKVLALEPRNSAGARRVMATLGTVLEVPDAERIWRAIDAGVSAAAQSLPPRAKPLRVYYEVSNGGYAAGPQSFIGELMARLGVQNIVGPELGPFPRVNPEYVVRANPDLIMIGERNVAGLAQRPGWQGIRALREQRLCVFTADESDVLVRPGPRMAEAARLMAACIRKNGLKP